MVDLVLVHTLMAIVSCISFIPVRSTCVFLVSFCCISLSTFSHSLSLIIIQLLTKWRLCVYICTLCYYGIFLEARVFGIYNRVDFHSFLGCKI